MYSYGFFFKIRFFRKKINKTNELIPYLKPVNIQGFCSSKFGIESGQLPLVNNYTLNCGQEAGGDDSASPRGSPLFDHEVSTALGTTSPVLGDYREYPRVFKEDLPQDENALCSKGVNLEVA